MTDLWTFTDRAGAEIRPDQGAELLKGDRTVARTDLEDGRVVVTQHVPICGRASPPTAFETVLFPADGYRPEVVRRRYATEAEAREGHEVVVASVRAEAAGDPVGPLGHAGVCASCGAWVGVVDGRIGKHARVLAGSYLRPPDAAGGETEAKAQVAEYRGLNWCEGEGGRAAGHVVRGFTADGEAVDSWGATREEALQRNAIAVDNTVGSER